MAGPITVTGTVDGVNATFTLAFALANEQIYVDRIREIPTTDYTLTGTSLVFTGTAIPPLGSLITVYGDILGTVSPSQPTTSRTGFATAGTIINRAAVQLGLATTGATSLPDPYASTDQNYVQLCEMLNMVGEDLQNKHEWAHFIREGTISTASSATSYAPPADFYKFVDETQWNRSTRLPMIGPLSGQATQYLKARLSGVLVQVAYRLQGNVITFAIAPSNSQTLAFEYVSSYWVWSAAGTAPNASAAVATGDTILYDQDLAIAGLKLAYLESKGFDTTKTQERYDDILEHSIYKNVGAKLLNLGGTGLNADHLIDASNLPITGYAQ